MREAILDFLGAIIPVGFFAYCFALAFWPHLTCAARGHRLQRQRRVVLDINGGSLLRQSHLCARCGELKDDEP